MSAAPMLSNALYSKWCATVAAALWSVYKDHRHARKIYRAGQLLGAVLCGSLQLVMITKIEKHLVAE